MCNCTVYKEVQRHSWRKIIRRCIYIVTAECKTKYLDIISPNGTMRMAPTYPHLLEGALPNNSHKDQDDPKDRMLFLPYFSM